MICSYYKFVMAHYPIDQNSFHHPIVSTEFPYLLTLSTYHFHNIIIVKHIRLLNTFSAGTSNFRFIIRVVIDVLVMQTILFKDYYFVDSCSYSIIYTLQLQNARNQEDLLADLRIKRLHHQYHHLDLNQ